MPRELFLSYSSHDQDAAALIVDDVERHTGWRFFQCSRPDDNPVGGDWTAALANHLTDCLAMVLVHSAHARASRYVHREIEMAVAIEKPIVAIRLDDVGWAPGVDYLMRTIQAPVVPRSDLPAYLPHLRRAIARLLPSALALPLDSISDRQLKVDSVCHLARLLAKEQEGVRLYGMGIKLGGIDSLFVASPNEASRIWEELCAELRASADFKRDKDGGFALLPVLSKEDVVLLLLVAPAARPKTTCHETMTNLRLWIAKLLVESGLDPTFKDGEQPLPDPLSGETPSRVADFLTGLGKDVEARDSGKPDKRLAGHPEALREVLRTLSRSTEPPPRTLPLALTGAAAWQQFAMIGRLERNLI